MKLSESPSPNEGFLEVNFNNKTVKVCTSSDQVGDVVCRYLGYSGRKQLPTKTTFSGISRHLDGFTADLTCSGLEPDLSSCCAKGTTAKDRNCSSLLYISCKHCRLY